MFENCIVKNAFVNENNSKKIRNRKDKKSCFISSLLHNGIIKNVKIVHPKTEYLLNGYKFENAYNNFGKLQLYLLDADEELEDINIFFLELGSELIFIDNIYKNKKATENWNKLINNDEITLCINFYHFGIISANKDFAKQNFTLKF